MKRRYRIVIDLILLLVIIFISRGNIHLGVFSKTQGKDNLPIYRVSREDKEIALTFDINWAENEQIYNILDVLDKYNVKGTFFIMGSWVNYSEENVQKLKKIYEGGHEIGNHSYKHPMFTKISKEKMLEELSKTDKIIEETIGIKPTLFRFPSGDYNGEAVKYINSLGYKIIQWDVDSLDWKNTGEEFEYNRVYDNKSSGSIVLYHNNTKYTTSNLEKIIIKLNEEEYKFLKVSELIYEENYYINEQGEQIKN